MPEPDRPVRYKQRYDKLLPGYRECYECGGDGACNICNATGVDRGNRCRKCNGNGLCVVCDGAGQISAAPVKKTLVLVGAFRELDIVEDPNSPSLADARGKRAPEHKAEVVSYLQAGKPMVVSPGEEAVDFFDSTRTTTTRSILTDGEYAWSKELAYYVQNYDVALGPVFERHMAAHDYRLPTVDTSKLKLPWW